MRLNKKLLMPIVIFLAVFLFVVFICCNNKAEWTSYEDYTLEEISEIETEVPYPRSARHIFCYKKSTKNGQIFCHFIVSEKDFFQWVKENGWKANTISGCVSFHLPDIAKKGPRNFAVTAGYVHHSMERGQKGSLVIVYDKDAGRAIYEYNSAALPISN